MTFLVSLLCGVFGVLGFELLFRPKTVAEHFGALILGVILGILLKTIVFP